jgi:hypothetical protein
LTGTFDPYHDATRRTKKAIYRIRNWRDYSQALVRRGSLTVWVDQQAIV